MTTNFIGSAEYWKQRYASGGNSGAGSYNELAEFKAEVLNLFVKENKIETVIEYGCGDGNQLTLAQYPSYLGFDVSPDAVARCAKLFAGDTAKIFKLLPEYRNETAQLTLSLDVIFHLVEDVVFDDYMKRLFASAREFVVVYSSNTDVNPPGLAEHVRHRNFSAWIEKNCPQWKCLKHIPNKHPFTDDEEKGSFASFFFYGRVKS